MYASETYETFEFDNKGVAMFAHMKIKNLKLMEKRLETFEKLVRILEAKVNMIVLYRLVVEKTQLLFFIKL